jgi:hypothetical protein
MPESPNHGVRSRLGIAAATALLGASIAWILQGPDSAGSRSQSPSVWPRSGLMLVNLSSRGAPRANTLEANGARLQLQPTATPVGNGVAYVDGRTYAQTTVGIQSAISSLPASGGEIVLLTGTYAISDSGNGYCILIDRPVKFVGTGIESTILKVSTGIASTEPIFRIALNPAYSPDAGYLSFEDF